MLACVIGMMTLPAMGSVVMAQSGDMVPSVRELLDSMRASDAETVESEDAGDIWEDIEDALPTGEAAGRPTLLPPLNGTMRTPVQTDVPTLSFTVIPRVPTIQLPNSQTPVPDDAEPAPVMRYSSLPIETGTVAMNPQDAHYRQQMSPKAMAIYSAIDYLGAAYDMMEQAGVELRLTTPVRAAMENLNREMKRMERDERNAIRAKLQQRLARLREEAVILEAILRSP